MGLNFIYVSFLTIYLNATYIPFSASHFASFFKSHTIHSSESSVNEASNVVAVVVIIIIIIIDVVVKSWHFLT